MKTLPVQFSALIINSVDSIAAGMPPQEFELTNDTSRHSLGTVIVDSKTMIDHSDAVAQLAQNSKDLEKDGFVRSVSSIIENEFDTWDTSAWRSPSYLQSYLIEGLEKNDEFIKFEIDNTINEVILRPKN